MKRLAHFLIRLYPRGWRSRYGEEFEALIDDAPPRFSAILDLCKGAVQMQSTARNFPRLALFLSVLGLAAGFAASFSVPRVYVSEAELRIMDTGGGSNALNRFIGLEQQVLSRTILKTVIEDPRLDLYPRERENTPLEDVIETMRTRHIRIVPVSHAGDAPKASYAYFTILYDYPDPHKAQWVVQTLIAKFMESEAQRQIDAAIASQTALGRLEQRVAVLEQRLGIASAPAVQTSYTPAANIIVLDPPNLPAKPIKPNRIIFAALGFGAGFILAIAIALLRRPTPLPPQLAGN